MPRYEPLDPETEEHISVGLALSPRLSPRDMMRVSPEEYLPPPSAASLSTAFGRNRMAVGMLAAAVVGAALALAGVSTWGMPGSAQKCDRSTERCREMPRNCEERPRNSDHCVGVRGGAGVHGIDWGCQRAPRSARERLGVLRNARELSETHRNARKCNRNTQNNDRSAQKCRGSPGNA